MDPSTIFTWTTSPMPLAWLLLATSLFVARLRPAAQLACALLVPGLLAVAYAVVLLPRLPFEQGGFGSLEEVALLFQDDWALLAGWIHYLAFDLFVGAWIVRDGLRRGVWRLLLLALLPLAFMLGPVGLLGYLLARPFFGGAATSREAR